MPARLFMSSGDMNADRRFDYARDLQVQGNLVAAEDLFVQATDLAPGFATAWFTLGEVREALGDLPGAIVAFGHARDTDAGDRNGAGLRLMRLGAGPLASMPPTYVTALFDQYAPKFESALVEKLGYRGPAVLFKAVLAVCAATERAMRFRRGIDLGCGTGLAGAAFAATTGAMTGIDLSPRMVERARATGHYAELEVAEIIDGLGRQSAASADLVVAADVLIYLHDLAPVLAQVMRVLAPGGLLAFTAESHGGVGVILGAGLRYAYSESYVRASIAASGLSLCRLDHISTRNEGNVPVPVMVVVAIKT
ncbi:methyltransferase domain-containing protein [Tardiphaga sp. vice352]|uniref:methyltransferase domain-containing protein n=1 Tax=unclassified Tardiphaga TaxID=2631404 RepID=UPI0011626124|nr:MULTISPECIES: methyltransferase domain-containing protein [unclassified Tardiphaga]QDM14548.1 methyltransferase domain-containing protein [Tardiphaga sp. vice278]QDM24745.1 methyltransferase domain-containing protein [Tardiphaga sp. vice304]QDM29937.1 methyltransferase domain-containing protein [Tardiphaga sp. vice352]